MRFRLLNPPTPQLVSWLRRASDRPGLLEVRALGTVAEVRYVDGGELDDTDAAEVEALVAAHNADPIRRRPPMRGCVPRRTM